MKAVQGRFSLWSGNHLHDHGCGNTWVHVTSVWAMLARLPTVFLCTLITAFCLFL